MGDADVLQLLGASVRGSLIFLASIKQHIASVCSANVLAGLRVMQMHMAESDGSSLGPRRTSDP